MRLVFLHMHSISVMPQPDDEMAEIMIFMPHFGGSAAFACAETRFAMPAMIAYSESLIASMLCMLEAEDVKFSRHGR